MANPILAQKRQELLAFVRQEIVPEAAVQAVAVIGSVAAGTARPDSDIDAVVFLAPFDPYAVPAEFQWRPRDQTFHGIFVELDEAVQFDFKRVDLAEWSRPAFAWPEPFCAEMAAGWLAFDRAGQVGPLIAAKTAYGDALRLERLDEAVVQLDQLLDPEKVARVWETLGELIAQDRLHAAYGELVAALFAYHRCWRPWRSREMTALLRLPWLPATLRVQMRVALNAPGPDVDGYQARVAVLQAAFADLLAQLQHDGLYGSDPISEAFTRRHQEPGRGDLEAWTRRRRQRAAL